MGLSWTRLRAFLSFLFTVHIARANSSKKNIARNLVKKMVLIKKERLFCPVSKFVISLFFFHSYKMSYGHMIVSISTTYKGTNLLGYNWSRPSIQVNPTVYNAPMLSPLNTNSKSAILLTRMKIKAYQTTSFTPPCPPTSCVDSNLPTPCTPLCSDLAPTPPRMRRLRQALILLPAAPDAGRPNAHPPAETLSLSILFDRLLRPGLLFGSPPPELPPRLRHVLTWSCKTQVILHLNIGSNQYLHDLGHRVRQGRCSVGLWPSNLEYASMQLPYQFGWSQVCGALFDFPIILMRTDRVTCLLTNSTTSKRWNNNSIGFPWLSGGWFAY
jgi:hypothetical protein